jgi:hypothetical protein
MDNANLNYTFTYLPCQTCHAKVRCNQCEQTILDRLMRIDGVKAGEVCIPKRLISILSENADPDEIDDEMDAIGVLLGFMLKQG